LQNDRFFPERLRMMEYKDVGLQPIVNIKIVAGLQYRPNTVSVSLAMPCYEYRYEALLLLRFFAVAIDIEWPQQMVTLRQNDLKYALHHLSAAAFEAA